MILMHLLLPIARAGQIRIRALMDNVQLNLPTGSAPILSNLRPGGYHEH